MTPDHTYASCDPTLIQNVIAEIDPVSFRLQTSLQCNWKRIVISDPDPFLEIHCTGTNFSYRLK